MKLQIALVQGDMCRWLELMRRIGINKSGAALPDGKDVVLWRWNGFS